MNDKLFKFNMEVMQEMGLEEGERRRVIDQDTGEVCVLGSKEIVTPGSQAGKNAIEFDAVTNPRLMSKLFSEFVDKLGEEGEIEPCISYSSYLNKPDNTISAKVIFTDGTSINSDKYKNEALCYVDMVKQLNGDEEIDLKDYDKDWRKVLNPKPKQPATKPTPKKKR